jgi:hypothetical protein
MPRSPRLVALRRLHQLEHRLLELVGLERFIDEAHTEALDALA